MKSPGDSLGLEASDSNFPTGAPGNLTVGSKLTDFLIDTGVTYIYCGKYQGGTENISVYPSHGSFWRMPTRGPHPETSRASNPPFGTKSPL